MMKRAPGWLQAILRWRGFTAVTLPPFGIYALPERMTSVRLHRHEIKHWEQYKRMGLVRFYVTYLWLTLRHGYKMNPMEVEARAAEVANDS